MKNEKGFSPKKKKDGLYGTPFQATTWAVEIHELSISSPQTFRWVAKYHNVEMSAYHPVDSDVPFKTAKEADDDFTALMKAQCICVCSNKVLTIADIAQQKR